MKVITEYTVAHIRRNRRTSLAIMIAVLLAGTLLCSFAMLAQGFWAWNLRSTIYEGGDWHGEIFADTPGDKLPIIEGNPHVEAVMVKGTWRAVKLPEGAALPYLLMRDANAAYWAGMYEQHLITEGRRPEKPGEVAVSKLFFERNPQYKIGDTLTLPAGDRILNGETIPAQSIRVPGEGFSPRGEVTLTITGKLDMSTSTVNPGYYALGFMERESIRLNDKLTVYLRFRDLYKTLALLPEIAEDIGLTQDEYGDYPVTDNASILAAYLADLGKGSERTVVQLATPAMVLCVIVLLICTFVLIIKGVFSLSADARGKQLGMFRSVGASPAQIRRSVMLEALLLSALPILLSVGLGYAFTQMLAVIFNNMLGEFSDTVLSVPFTITFHLPTAVTGALMTLIVVLRSASGPARLVAKLTPIEAVRGGAAKKLKRRRFRAFPLFRLMFGFTGELAAESVAARRKSFRSSAASVCISFVLVSGTLSMLAISNLLNDNAAVREYYDVTVELSFSESRDDALVEELRNIPGVTESAVTSGSILGFMVDESLESDDFAALGGFATADADRYNIAPMGDGFRVGAVMYGLDDRSFTEFCAARGLNAAEYLEAEPPMAVIQNALQPYLDAREPEQRDTTIELLKINTGDRLTFLEQAHSYVNSSHTFEVTAGYITTEPIPQINYGMMISNRPVIVVPMSRYDEIVADFVPERASIYRATEVKLVTGGAGGVSGLEVERRAKEICERYLGGEDFSVQSKEGDSLTQNRVNSAVNTMNAAIAVMFALIGISNAFTSVAASLRIRRREFAMLRSVGLDERGLVKLLFAEGLNFSLRPILLGLPFIFLICYFFLFMSGITWAQFLPAFPAGGILLYALIALAMMGLAYLNGARYVRGSSIADVLKDETV